MNEDLVAGIREAVRGVTARFGREYYLEVTRRGGAPWEMYAAMGEQGLFELGVDEALGGSGGGVFATALVMEEMSRAGVPPMMYSLTSFARQSVLRSGTPEQIDRFVKPTLNGQRTFCFALTEPDAGTNSLAIRTFARRDDDGSYRISGKKVFISGADIADDILLVARTSELDPAHRVKGLSVFVVPRDTPGVTMTPMAIDWNAPERQFMVYFDDAIVPPENLIGAEGEGLRTMFDALNAERVVIAAWAIGLGEFVLEKAVNYVSQRAPWGKPLGSYQAVAHPLARAKIQLDAARCMTYRAASDFDSGVEAGNAANMAKFVASEASYAAVDAAIQVHGGSSFDPDSDVVSMYPMIRILRIAPLNNEMILNSVAKDVLGLPRSY